LDGSEALTLKDPEELLDEALKLFERFDNGLTLGNLMVPTCQKTFSVEASLGSGLFAGFVLASCIAGQHL